MKKYFIIILVMSFFGIQRVKAQVSYTFKPDTAHAKNRKFYGKWVAIKGNKTYTLDLKETEIRIGSLSKAIEGSLQVVQDGKLILKLPRNSTDQFLVGSVSSSTGELICFIEDTTLNIYSKIIITSIDSNSFKWRFDRTPEAHSSKKLLSAPTDLIFYRK
jgi:hypothetical protein